MVLRKPNSNKSSFSPAEKAILTTIIYSDIFHFPLTEEELWRFLISNKKISSSDFSLALSHLNKTHLVKKDDYYALKDQSHAIDTRKLYLAEVKKKFLIAEHAARKMSLISSILFIGISGSLAAQNVKKKDDIDLFIIVKKNTLYTTRLLILLMLEKMKLRRKRGVVESPDNICVNLLIDETAIPWSAHSHDLYTAREIAQLIPLYDSGYYYESFIKNNSWLKQFFPNILSTPPLIDLRIKRQRKATRISSSFLFIMPESILRSFQIIYMNRHRTTEIIEKHQLAFHPVDYKTKVLDKLKLKMRLLGLLTI